MVVLSKIIPCSIVADTGLWVGCWMRTLQLSSTDAEIEVIKDDLESTTEF